MCKTQRADLKIAQVYLLFISYKGQKAVGLAIEGYSFMRDCKRPRRDQFLETFSQHLFRKSAKLAKFRVIHLIVRSSKQNFFIRKFLDFQSGFSRFKNYPAVSNLNV